MTYVEDQRGDAQPGDDARLARAEVAARHAHRPGWSPAGHVDVAAGRSSSNAATTSGVDRVRVEPGLAELVERARREAAYGGRWSRRSPSVGESVGGAAGTNASARRRPAPVEVAGPGASSRSGKSSRQWSRGSPRAARRPRPGRADREQVGGLPGVLVDPSAGSPASSRARSARAAEPVGERSTPARDGHLLLEVAAHAAPSTRPGGPAVGAGVGPRPQLAGQHLGDPAREHQALEQGVGGQPVGAVDAGAGDLAGGVEARGRSAPPEVGGDAAARRSGRRGRPGSAR